MNRREFIKAGALAGGGLWLSLALPGCSERVPVALSAFVHIHSDGKVEILTPVADLGQGSAYTLAHLIAHELAVDMAQVIVNFAPFGAAFAGSDARQSVMFSNSIREWHAPCRRLGAAARMALINAAAAEWQVSPGECNALGGTVHHPPSGKRLSYARLAPAASQMAPPQDPILRPDPVPAPDAFGPRRRAQQEKVTGQATYGADVRLPDQLYAAVAMAPTFDGQLDRFDGSLLEERSGIAGVYPVPGGVAVVAERWWQARTALDEISVDFTRAPSNALGAEAIEATLMRALDRSGSVTLAREGRVDAAFRDAFASMRAVYDLPFLAHACPEPSCATAYWRNGNVHVIAPVQDMTRLARAIAEAGGVPDDRITVENTVVGGSFGRRVSDVRAAQQAVLLSRQARRPVQVIWDRASDMIHDHLRPAGKLRLSGALDDAGRPTALTARIAAPGLMESLDRSDLTEDGRDLTIGQGLLDSPYAIANRRIDWSRQDFPLMSGIWRSLFLQPNVFALESFMDELAHLGGRDPLTFRHDLLAADKRSRRILDVVAERASWRSGGEQTGRALGLAFFAARNSICGLVADVSVKDGRIQIHKITAAIDAGRVFSVDGVKAQIEGGIAMGLGAAMMEKTTIERGQPQARNFDKYAVPRMADMPDIDVVIVESDAPPGGAGELGVPGVAPAVANAVFAASGHRIRRLPLADYPFTGSGSEQEN